MLFSLLGNGLASGAGSAWARRLRHVRYHADRHLRHLSQRCDAAFRSWGARRLAREMQSWPDERLKDVGLSRAEIASAIEGVRRPFQWVPDHDAAKMTPSRFGH